MEWGLLGRYSPEQDKGEVPGPVWIDYAGPGTGSCLAETVQRASSDRLLVLIRNAQQEQNLVEIELFIQLGG